ncbi:MAG TPA: Ku protein [Verrucomicrobiae bacterium]|nr:Ku protein [Verrucomicrobiae bacterium]
MPHAIWKGSISFGLVNIPVGLYTAEKKDELDFVLLDKRDLGPVGYRRYNKKTGQEIPWKEVVKGFEHEEGEYVVLNPADFKQANPEATQTVDIVDFVDLSQIPPVYYTRPYYLEPVKKAKKSYALLREALKKSGKAGIANVVIHTRQYVGAVVPMGKMLVLNLLRFKNELKSADDFDLPAENLEEIGVTDKELDMAQKLIEGMIDNWQPEKYHDTYRDDLMQLINRKIEQGETRVVVEEGAAEPAPEQAEVIDLMSLLSRSVKEVKEGRKGSGGNMAA